MPCNSSLWERKGLSPFLETDAGGVKVHSFFSLFSHFWNASVRLKIMPVGCPWIAGLGMPRVNAFFHSSVLCSQDSVCEFLSVFSLGLTLVLCGAFSFTGRTQWSSAQGLGSDVLSNGRSHPISWAWFIMSCMNSAQVGSWLWWSF